MKSVTANKKSIVTLTGDDEEVLVTVAIPLTASRNGVQVTIGSTEMPSLTKNKIRIITMMMMMIM